MPSLEDLSPSEREKVIRAAGQCNFSLVFLFATTAMCLSAASTSYCSFVSRDVTYDDTAVNLYCNNRTDSDQCFNFFKDQGIGFWSWQATIPVDQVRGAVFDDLVAEEPCGRNAADFCLSHISSVLYLTRYFVVQTSSNIISNKRVCLSYTLLIPGKGYVTPQFDTKFNAARAFAGVADFFGLLCFLTLAMASCCPLDQARLKCMSIYFFLAFFFQAMTLIIFRSSVCQKGFFSIYFDDPTAADSLVENVSCGLTRGSNMAIAATGT